MFQNSKKKANDGGLRHQIGRAREHTTKMFHELVCQAYFGPREVSLVNMLKQIQESDMRWLFVSMYRKVEIFSVFSA